jgi:hypothetical protein
MYILTHTGTNTSEIQDDKKIAKPHEQYLNNVLSEYEVIATVVGRNKKATVFQPTIEVHPYPLWTNPNIRGQHLIVSFTDAGVGFFNIKTNFETPISPKLMEKQWGKNPLTFFNYINEVESKYSEDNRIEHSPWLEQLLFSKKFAGKIIRTWSDVKDVWPELFK